MLPKKINILLITESKKQVSSVHDCLLKSPHRDKLHQFGHQSSPAEALAVLSDQPSDVVLLDLESQKDQGTKLLEKARPILKEYNVIILIAKEDEPLISKAIEFGAEDYLTITELSPKSIWRCISYAIERKKLESIKDEFISLASHELKTPVTIIKQAVDILQKEAAADLKKEHREFLNIAERNIKRLHEIIVDLLDLSRLESGRVSVEWGRIKLDEFLEEIRTNFKSLMQEKKFNFSVTIDASAIEVHADHELLIRVMNNLLSNAMRFADHTITVNVKKETLEKGRATIVFGVENDGPQLTEEQTGKLFQKFVQLDRPKQKQGYKGTGLGLAICKEIIDQHKGKIWVKSEPGSLTGFYFAIPQ